MMPKHSSRAPWGRRLTAMIAVSLLTLSACSDSGGGIGGSSIEVVEILTLPNNQALTNLVPGTTRQMFGVPTNGSGNWVDRPVAWESSNPAVATVDANTGLLTTLLGGGTTYIRATSGGQTDSVRVDVRFPVGDINFDTGDFESRREGARELVVEVLDTQTNPVTDRTITWASSDETVAMVDDGVISATEDAVDGTTATITATAANAADGGVVVTQTLVVTVMGDAVVATVSVEGGSGVWGTPETAQLTATPLSGLGNTLVAPIDFTTSNPAIATVDAAGLVTFAGDTGAVTITATATGAGDAGADITGTAEFRALPLIENGVPIANVAAASGEDAWFAFFVPADATEMTVTLAGATGDADLYLYRPGSSGITHASAAGGSNESVTVVRGTPAGSSFTGWWLVRMNAWDGDADVTDNTVTATHNAP